MCFFSIFKKNRCIPTNTQPNVDSHKSINDYEIKKNLFNKLCENQEFWNAQIVGKNIFCNDPSNKDSFCIYFDFCIEQANCQTDLDSCAFFLNEADYTLSLFCEKCNMSEDIFNLIDIKRKKVQETSRIINSNIHEAEEESAQKTVLDNDKLINSLESLYVKLQDTTNQNEFDTTIKEVSKAEESLQKGSFTVEQKDKYDALSKRYSKLVSDKMRKLQWQSDKEYNLLAAETYKNVYDSFKEDPKKYKKDTNEFHYLICNKLCSFDNSRLTNETIVFYNFVYQYIFNEVNDDLKIKMTTYSINSNKSI